VDDLKAGERAQVGDGDECVREFDCGGYCVAVKEQDDAAKARQEAQKAKAQARKGSIPIGMVQQSYSRGAPVSASASSASAATVSSTETQYGWTATRNQISF
jgi:predicted ATP-grasp superfamily ATP-dependent carboligase